MPSYMQSNLPGSVPDDKIPAGNLKVAAEFSFPGNGPSVLSPDKLLSNETVSDLQASADNPLSPATDYSPEVLWSLPLSVDNRASLTDTSSSCSSPRISVIIAQEASTTKINSRFFTVETMEPWDFEEYRIAEEHQCVMEVEGEFCFGREKSKTSRAEREAIFSLHRDAKSRSCNSNDLIKEEEITLSPSEIDLELQTLEALHRNLERRGVEIEHSLRESMDSERPFNDCEDELLREWLSVVHERNVILRRDSELIYLLQSHNYEERYRTVEGELRKLVAMRDEVKSSDDLKRERELLSELLELVQKRSFIVDSLEEERVREIHEDEKVEQALTDGIAALPGNRWDQRPDCTKVAFSRFYC
ncbi:filamin binding [Desmophyllum pertusum]|uniref:Filamin binding n=1 Tax=Desmophyllum pertusum TaxID=174260 RepID=A0A9W9Z2T9_9CNID|nr:filamin binding [Desmophyllum pertusum]